MTPRILISGTITVPTSALVEIVSWRDASVTVFAAGLAGTEEVVISLLAAAPAGGPSQAAAGDWLALKVAGEAVVLDVDTPARLLDAPGIYKLSIASSAGDVSIGHY
jgi:hypothetical protein